MESSSQSPPLLSDKNAAINIVGAGVFGLSTAIHLAQRGYKNITMFDKQPYDVSRYSYFKGCDAASADMNKIFRSAYGAQTEYQNLSIEASSLWRQWNEEIASGNVPEGMNSERDKVFLNHGNLSLTDQSTLPAWEEATMQNMNAAGLTNSQLNTYDPAHVQLAQEKGFGYGIDPFHRRQRGQSYLGVLDTTGGTLLADKACYFALHKAKTLGVRTIFGPQSGTLESFIYSSSSSSSHDTKTVTGIRTLDGKSHYSSFTIMACGGWTPALLPELDSVCEATAGSVVIMKLPDHLARRYSPHTFPSWTYNIRDGAEGGLYGFAATDDGYMKIGYRGTKYTNPKLQHDGRERSVPVTRYTDPERITDEVPAQAIKVVKRFIADFLPDLPANGVGIDLTRLCWYTDSWDNHFVIDHVPGRRGVFVATAGSGHAFKFLPNIGAWVVDVLEGKGLERQLVKSWKWRTRPETKENVVNELMQGSEGPRALKKTKMSVARKVTLSPRANL
ncbi:hypothetical protein A1O1_07019 [Capronia coronata CBS 617.96]|uniref:FAD dependent oxidoreductase domain-containing protein n=1 Tax=Capronia coronata CBS 617.96 TaxID=1182541 RepID=W9XS86_9EURO|nr:uncharacterized protein A1O1_07019 [Capronia coronata CBS 617.96]EXJ83397.1 hypothetical protein A1O1_07019 [Capronia coronata CBS 617.96]